MTISIIIPHLNQPAYLEKCLAALHDQNNAPAGIEIIVVDNGSDAMPQKICEQWPGTVLLQETTPGPGPARNRGIEQASGDLLAFIDADCAAHPNWLAAICASFQNPGALVIGGDVQVPIEDADNPTSLECYERIYAYRNKKYIASGYSGTGNLAMRRTIYNTVGPFAGIGVAEDRDWGLRAGAVGIKTQYVAGMIVFHPARKTHTEMQQKWDRHIAHDFSKVTRPRDRVRWIIRAVAIGLSPIAEIFRIAQSDRISGLQQRWLAFRYLVTIRAYRFWRMMTVVMRGDGQTLSRAWNRKNSGD